MAGNSTESGRSVTSKITSILMTFTEGSEHSLTEIARLAGLPISTAHRLTSELASWRLLERTEDGLYRAGLPLRMIGTGDAVPAQHRASARPACSRTSPRPPAAGSGSACCSELEVAYIEKQPGPRPGHRLLRRRPRCPRTPPRWAARCSPSAPTGTVEMTIMRGLRPYTPHTVTSPDRFRRALAVTRLTRVAVTRLRAGAERCGVAMPVFGPGGEVVAAIELTVRDLGHDLQPVHGRRCPSPPAACPASWPAAHARAGAGPRRRRTRGVPPSRPAGTPERPV